MMTRTSVVVWSALAGILATGCTPAREAPSPSGPIAPAATITLTDSITALAPIAASSTIVAGLEKGQVVVWNGHDTAPSVTLTPHTFRVIAVGATADLREVWSLAIDGSLVRSEVATGKSLGKWPLDLGPLPARGAAFSSDLSMLVTGGEFGEIRVFDTASATLRHTLRGHRTELQSLVVRPGSAIVASASAESDLRLWDATAGREVGSVDSDLSLFALAFNPRDGTLASGGVDRRVTIRDAATFKPVGEVVLPAPKLVSTLAWSPDGRLIALGDLDDATLSKGGIQILDAATRAVVVDLDTKNVAAGALTFMDTVRVAAALGHDLRVWTVSQR